MIDRAAIPRAPILPGIGALTEGAWSVIESFLPVRRSRLGRPHIPHRQLLEGMIAVMQLGLAWRSLPPSFGPWQTVYDRYAEWLKQGIWAQIVAILGVSCFGRQ
ncbi:MAG TPA: transposase [Pseudonocardiaceae bacterium]|nr:transposase [Pseudonocardiaceae bacterium]